MLYKKTFNKIKALLVLTWKQLLWILAKSTCQL